MRIKCPWCGDRPREEFSYYGDAAVERPAGGGDDDFAAWMDFAYLRENPAGAHRELWHHASGCRSWLTVERDTTTHGISSVRFTDPERSGRKS